MVSDNPQSLIRRQLGSKGATLIEIVVATAILAMVAVGLYGAFLFSRRGGWRSETELRMADFTQRIADELRTVVNVDNADGLSLAPGNIYVNAVPPYDFDPSTPALDPPPTPCASIPVVAINALNVPAELQRFDVRVRYYVEDNITQVAADNDDDTTCADGARGQDFDGDSTADLLWARIIVDWDSPQL